MITLLKLEGPKKMLSFLPSKKYQAIKMAKKNKWKNNLPKSKSKNRMSPIMTTQVRSVRVGFYNPDTNKKPNTYSKYISLLSAQMITKAELRSTVNRIVVRDNKIQHLN